MSEIESILPWITPLILPLFWASICFLVSKLSGWASLATHYATNVKPQGERYNAQSMGLGFTPIFMVSYGSILTAHISDKNLYLKPWFIFRIGHATLEIPLKHIKAVPGKVLFFKVTKLQFHNVPTLKGRMFGVLGERLVKITMED